MKYACAWDYYSSFDDIIKIQDSRKVLETSHLEVSDESADSNTIYTVNSMMGPFFSKQLENLIWTFLSLLLFPHLNQLWAQGVILQVALSPPPRRPSFISYSSFILHRNSPCFGLKQCWWDPWPNMGIRFGGAALGVFHRACAWVSEEYWLTFRQASRSIRFVRGKQLETLNVMVVIVRK